MSSPQKFIVTGGTGRIGTAFVHAMTSRGHHVRVGTRRPQGASARLRARFGPGRAEPVALPVDDPQALDAAFQGCVGMLLIAPFGDDMDAFHATMVEAAARADLKHIVKVSVTGARSPDSDPPPGRFPSIHWRGEELVRGSGIASTMIRPTIFAQHFMGLSSVLFRQGDDAFHLPTGDTGVAWLDCRDIAECAAAILSSEEKRREFAGEAFELTGPQSVTAADIEDILTLVSGRDIVHVDGEDAFTRHAADIGAPDTARFIYAEGREGWFGQVEDDAFVRATGRHTTSFARFAYDHQWWFKAHAPS